MRRLVPRLLACFAAIAAATTLLSGCRSTSTNVTGPSSTRCAVSLSGTGLTVAGGGGTGTVSVSVDRECAWTASSDAGWISITSGASGQGPGTIGFAVATNPAGAPRQGNILVGTQRAIVQQEAAACTFQVSSTSATIGASGGTLDFAVTTPAGCAWSASTPVPWMAIVGPPDRTGSGGVSVTVSANAGAPRSSTIAIAGTGVVISQGGGGAACSYAISLSASAFGAEGGAGTATVTTTPGCEWTASGSEPWLTVAPPGGGSGSGTVAFSVAANTGGARAATLTVAGQGFAVTQSWAQASCRFAVSPGSRAVDSGGGTGTFDVVTTGGCEWMAASNASWLAVTAGAHGSGSGTVTFSAAFNSGAARSGTLSIAGETVTVVQAATTCAFNVDPASVSIPSSGGPASVAVTTGASCAWTAASDVPWIAITSGAAGTGSGPVTFAIDANTGGAREGTLTVAGQRVTVRQGGVDCAYRLSPSSLSIGAAGGTSVIAVSTSSGCTWTAAANDTWISVTAGASGNGSGSVTLSVSANSGAARTGTLTIAGQAFVVSQAAAGTSCTYAIAPSSQSVAAAGDRVSVSVTAPAGCAWVATSDVPWVTMASGASGSGNGTATLLVLANADTTARTGTVSIAGQTFTVQQAGVPCSYAIVPASASVGAAAGTASVDVATTAGCAWTAASDVPWLKITGGSSGSGSGRVTLEHLANTDVQPRTGTLTIAGLKFTVTQAAAACTYAVTPTEINGVAAAGSTASISVATAGGCQWTATSSVNWVRITSGASGSGNGTVTIAIEPNTGAARTGTLTVAGQTVRVNQQ